MYNSCLQHLLPLIKWRIIAHLVLQTMTIKLILLMVIVMATAQISNLRSNNLPWKTRIRQNWNFCTAAALRSKCWVHRSQQDQTIICHQWSWKSHAFSETLAAKTLQLILSSRISLSLLTMWQSMGSHKCTIRLHLWIAWLLRRVSTAHNNWTVWLNNEVFKNERRLIACLKPSKISTFSIVVPCLSTIA